MIAWRLQAPPPQFAKQLPRQRLKSALSLTEASGQKGDDYVRHDCPDGNNRIRNWIGSDPVLEIILRQYHNADQNY